MTLLKTNTTLIAETEHIKRSKSNNTTNNKNNSGGSGDCFPSWNISV